jgi:hypothetical protein
VHAGLALDAGVGVGKDVELVSEVFRNRLPQPKPVGTATVGPSPHMVTRIRRDEISALAAAAG